jgi:hypothetical protein
MEEMWIQLTSHAFTAELMCDDVKKKQQPFS